MSCMQLWLRVPAAVTCHAVPTQEGFRQGPNRAHAASATYSGFWPAAECQVQTLPGQVFCGMQWQMVRILEVLDACLIAALPVQGPSRRP